MSLICSSQSIPKPSLWRAHHAHHESQWGTSQVPRHQASSTTQAPGDTPRTAAHSHCAVQLTAERPHSWASVVSLHDGHRLVVLQFEIPDVHCLPGPGLSCREMTATVTRTALDSPGTQQTLSQGYPLLPMVTALKGDSLGATREQGHFGCSLLELEGSRWPRPGASLPLRVCHQVCRELWGKGLSKIYF